MFDLKLTLGGVDDAIQKYGKQHESTIVECARMAVNDTIRFAYSNSKKFMNDTINFPSGYLDRDDRFSVKKYASSADLEAHLFARSEPTSLARFAIDAGSKQGIMVHVRKGVRAKLIRKAFFMNLRSGNRGIIVRSQGKPNNAYKPKQMRNPDLWAVYGPSVYQVFRNWLQQDNNETKIADRLEARFQHHLARKLQT